MKNLFLSFLLLILGFTTNSHAQMVDNAETLGIDTTFGHDSFCGGVSFVDFNQDGWDDLTFATESGDSILFYVNNQGTGFTRIKSLVGHIEHSKQVIWADTDNDGDLDFFVCTEGGQNRFYQNNGNLELADSTYTCGLLIQNDASFGANFGDFDQDGDLDLFISNREFFYGNTFYRNDGNNTFVDITASVGVNLTKEADFCSAFLDYDNDLDSDLYTILDKYPYNNKLFQNNGNGSFIDVSNSSGAGIYIEAMNAGVGDFDGNGYLDIYVTNTFAGSALLKNNGNGTFTDVASAAGVLIQGGFNFGASWLDADNDKDLDLYVCSYLVNPTWHNRLFENNGDGTFDEMAPSGLPGDTLNSFACAIGDHNMDGLVDIVVINNFNNKIQLWENEIVNTNRYVRIKLKGTLSNSQGIGSWIEVYTDGQKQVRFTHTSISYLGQNSLTEHIGLSTHGFIDSLIVRWPSGIVNRHYCLTTNTTFEVMESGSISDLNELAKTNIWLGGNGNCNDPGNWSLGHIPVSDETVIMRSPDQSVISITNSLSQNITFQHLVIEANVTFINHGMVNLLNNGGNGLKVEMDALVNNFGSISVSNVCNHAIDVTGTLTNEGTILISGELGKDAIAIRGGGQVLTKPGTVITLDPD